MNPALNVLGKCGTNNGTENQKAQFSSKEINLILMIKSCFEITSEYKKGYQILKMYLEFGSSGGKKAPLEPSEKAAHPQKVF